MAASKTFPVFNTASDIEAAIALLKAQKKDLVSKNAAQVKAAEDHVKFIIGGFMLSNRINDVTSFIPQLGTEEQQKAVTNWIEKDRNKVPEQVPKARVPKYRKTKTTSSSISAMTPEKANSTASTDCEDSNNN